MQRKIYARIWDKQNKKWLNRKVDIFSEEMRLCLSMIDDFSNFEISEYSGKKDTNGHEIWEGDYILTGDMFADYRCLWVIGFWYAKFMVETVSSNVIELNDLDEITGNKVKNYVVGNKYEDDLPELVKKIYPRPTDDSK